MKQRKTENFILLLVSLGCIGMTVESVLMGWEFWVPPLIILGTILIWVMNISSWPDYEIRTVAYLIYAMLAVFFHGVHETSFFDAALVAVLAMVGYSLFDHVYMMNLFLLEYWIIMFIQIMLAHDTGHTTFDALTVSRILLDLAIVALVFFCCVKSIDDRLEVRETENELRERIENTDADMEDFLSNISHELRTPVNVVNGMSDLLIKKNVGSEPYSIKDAGIRLAYQIEDIQDYTECKRKKVLLDEDDYMSTSLINDVVTSFRMLENNADLGLVVDLNPAVPTRMRGDVRKLHKIFRHLLENAVKFTKRGGIYVKMYTENKDYGVNLCIEMTDTGIGMDRKAIEAVSEGMYQVNKKRNRSSGGIGLGLFIVYGFAHRMGGFVKIESRRSYGTTIRVTVPQKVVDESPCLSLSGAFKGDILFHVRSDKYKVPRVRDFYRAMAADLAIGLRVPLYSAETIREIENLIEKQNVTYIFMGQEEYEENPEYFDKLSEGDIVVAVSAGTGFKTNPGSKVMMMPKPLYGYPAVKILNEGRNARNIEFADSAVRPVFNGVRALIVDDEPMNLVVASSLFSGYGMITETADSGKEAIKKFRGSDYDLVFMDHMMPEMDGVEAMKELRRVAEAENRTIVIVVLTANVVSGAREMFMREGFDGFIAKPINTADFERVLLQVLPGSWTEQGGENA
ncbi:MAG: hybrid sensor histidine kinase/response regulator [Lachnospiraceae bacterium]|nr:hybrid sensor histidine kinase/response regulator [Lachnospiraceae bacterium]